jgi:cysteinyl-tRNA synthetase
LEESFRAAMDEDLNAPQAIAALFRFVREANRELDGGMWSRAAAAGALGVLDRVMDVLDLLPSSVAASDELRQWIEQRLAERQAARVARDFATADLIRAELADRGVDLEDTPQGTRWKLRGG